MKYQATSISSYEEGIIIITPTRLFESKTEKAKRLIEKGDLNSLLEVKKLIIEMINENRSY